jgi:methenyltetrahydrofolate cyclohydrolase
LPRAPPRSASTSTRTERSSDSPDAPPAAAPGSHNYAGLPVSEFLDALAAGSAAPAGGSAAALTVAQAAALCAKTARLSARVLTDERSAELTSDAERIRAEAASLIDADARAYGAVIEASRRAAAARSKAAAQDELDARIAELREALSDAADVPMRIVQLASDVAQLAVTLCAFGNEALRGDAVAAALLAQAAARSAALMIAINLTDTPGDARPARASDVLAAIAQSVDLAAG